MAPKSLRWGILAVHTENSKDSCEDVDKKLAYNTEINDLINYIKNTLKRKFNEEVTHTMIRYNELTITEVIRSWSDKDEYIDIIFIIGYPYSSDKDENNIDITKMIEKITTEQIIKKYAEITARLKSKFPQIICRMQSKTLIINLFGIKEAITFDKIVTEMDPKQKLMSEKSIGKFKNILKFCKMKKKIRQATTSSSSNTEQVNENEDESHEEFMLNLDIEREDDGQNSEKFPSPSSMESDLVNVITMGAELTSSERIEIQIANVHAIVKKFSSLVIRMKGLKIPNENVSDNKEYSSSSVTNEELENTSDISINDALSKIYEIVKNSTEERRFELVNTNDAYGRIAAEMRLASCDLPPFRTSSKHGYAVLASDGEGIRTLLHKTTSDPVSLETGTCTYVKSGDRVPDEATAVVRINDAQKVNNTQILIKINPEVEQNIKAIGSDIPKDKLIISPYTRIGLAELGFLTAMGLSEVMVVKPVSIGILSIDDFLVKPGRTLRPGYVYDSNRLSLIALLKDNGFNSIVDFGVVTDDEQSIQTKIGDVLQQVKVLVTIGCTSEYDSLRNILRNHFHATIHFGNICVKPGKSTTFATCELKNDLKYLVCLSRNLVTALVSAHLFLLPILNGLHGVFEEPCKIPASVNNEFRLHPRPRVVWATLRWNDLRAVVEPRSKKYYRDKLITCQGANTLLFLPSQTEKYRKVVSALPIK